MAFRFGIRRRWLRISVRTLLLIVLVISVFLGYVSNRARKQAELVRRLMMENRALIGFRQGKHEAGAVIPQSAIEAPAWLRSLVGDHAFLRIYRVNTLKASEDDLRELADYPTIEGLKLDDGVRDGGMQYVGRLPNLEELEVRSPHITDKTLTYLSGLHKLRLLHLFTARITDEGLKQLVKLTNLEELNLQGTQVTIDGAKWLQQRLPEVTIYPADFVSAPEEHEAVERLIASGARFSANQNGQVKLVRFYGKEITDDELAPLESLKELEALELKGTRITSAGIERLRETHPAMMVMPAEIRKPIAEEAQAVSALQAAGVGLIFDRRQGYVTSIQSSDEELDPAVLGWIVDLHHLNSVKLGLARIGDKEVEYLSKVDSLQSLDLPNAELNDSALQQLSRLSKLRFITANVPNASDDGIASLSACASLSGVTLYKVAIQGRGLAELKNVNKDLRLSFQSSARLSDEGIAHIAKLIRLSSLDLKNCQITDQGLAHLQNLTNLQRLYLQGGSITDEGLIELTKLPKLKNVSLHNMHLTAEGRDRFKELRPDCQVDSVDWQ